MSLAMKLVYWFVVFNAYAGAISLLLFPSDTQSTFFWTIAPPAGGPQAFRRPHRRPERRHGVAEG